MSYLKAIKVLECYLYMKRNWLLFRLICEKYFEPQKFPSTRNKNPNFYVRSQNFWIGKNNQNCCTILQTQRALNDYPTISKLAEMVLALWNSTSSAESAFYRFKVERTAYRSQHSVESLEAEWWVEPTFNQEEPEILSDMMEKLDRMWNASVQLDEKLMQEVWLLLLKEKLNHFDWSEIFFLQSPFTENCRYREKKGFCCEEKFWAWKPSRQAFMLPLRLLIKNLCCLWAGVHISLFFSNLKSKWKNFKFKPLLKGRISRIFQTNRS